MIWSWIFLPNFRSIKSRNEYNTNFITLQSLVITLLVERIRASEVFFAMHRAHHRILSRGPVFSTSIHVWKPFSSPFYGFRPCITVEGNLVDGNPPFLVVFLFATAVHNTPKHHVFFLRTTKTLKPAKAAFLYWRHRSTIRSLPSCAVLYPTGSHITRICPPPTRGTKIDRNFFLLDFHTRSTWRFDQANRKKKICHIHLSWSELPWISLGKGAIRDSPLSLGNMARPQHLPCATFLRFDTFWHERKFSQVHLIWKLCIWMRFAFSLKVLVLTFFRQHGLLRN